MKADPTFDCEMVATINGERVARRVDARQHLADFLRDDLALTGTHLGCEHGVCGACAVKVNGKVVRGCLMLAVQANGCNIETIEGASDSGALNDLQSQFFERNAAQCGFCTPGMLLAASELIELSPIASRIEIREALSGNLCRCTGYQAIIDAVEATLKCRGAV